MAETRFDCDGYEAQLDVEDAAFRAFQNNIDASEVTATLLAELILQQIETRRLLARVLEAVEVPDVTGCDMQIERRA